MTLEQCLARFGEDLDPANLEVCWGESMATLPAEPPDWLRPKAMHAEREYCRMDPAVDTLLDRAAEAVVSDPALYRLIWHFHRCLYHEPTVERFSGWPTLEPMLGDLAGVPYLIAGLAMCPLVREVHAERDVDPEITRDTCLQIRCFCENYRDAHGGNWGLPLSQAWWLRNYTAGRLYRVGRFEYMLVGFRGSARVFRHRDTRAVVALAEDGIAYDAEGFYVQGDAPAAFTSTLRIDDERAVGLLVHPSGMALRETVELSLAEWEPVLAKGDTVLDMHIPSGGGMSPEACLDSLSRAVPFFRKTFPEKPFETINCVSWIYNTQFEDMLGPEANLVKHLRELYLYPVWSSGNDGLFFLFHTDDVDPATARQDTSMRRAVVEHLAAGRRLRSSGMFVMVEDLDSYGTEHYRSTWDQTARLARG